MSKQPKTDYAGITKLILGITAAYLLITNWDMIMIGGIASALIFTIIIVVAAYYILPAVGVTALTGLVGALGALIGMARRK